MLPGLESSIGMQIKLHVKCITDCRSLLWNYHTFLV